MRLDWHQSLNLLLASIILAAVSGIGSLACAQEADLPGDEPADEVALAAVEDAVEKPAGTPCRLLHVRLPLTGSSDTAIKRAIQRAAGELMNAPNKNNPRRPLLILQFDSSNQHADIAGRGTDFERAVSVARYLSSKELAAVKTVAYLPQSIEGHAVLVAIACEEIVMAPTATLGNAKASEPAEHVEPAIVSMYQQIAKSRRTVPEAIAVAMIESRQDLLRVETENSIEFVTRDQLVDIKKTHTIVSQEVLVPRGSTANFTGREGRQFGFVKYLANNRNALAQGLRVEENSIIEDRALASDWRPVIIDIEGPLTKNRVRQLETLIGEQISRHDVNWIGFRIDSTGGELEACLELADVIARLDSSDVFTVAYVPVEATGGANWLALAANQLIMHPNATLGGKLTIEVTEEQLDTIHEQLAEGLAPTTKTSASLLMALIDPSFEIREFRNSETGETRLMSTDEAESLGKNKLWRRGRVVKEADASWDLTSKVALELGLAWQVVESYDELKRLYSIEDPPIAMPNWALDFVEKLSSPVFAGMLLALGFIGIYVELHSPGIGIGAFIACVAFLLFFWSNVLHGTAGWLEVLLFVGGVTAILLEIFVLPGFGIFGLGGAGMIVISLILASQTFIIPQTELQLVKLRTSITTVVCAGVGLLGGSMLLRRYLPHAPIFRGMMLNPPAGEELVEQQHREEIADYEHLIGSEGTAATNLLPAGKARIKGQLIDVTSDGDFIERHTKIKVVSARGSHVVVQALKA